MITLEDSLKDLLLSVFEENCIHLDQYHDPKLGSDWEDCNRCLYQ